MRRFNSKPVRLTWRGKPSRYYMVRCTYEDGRRSWVSTGCENKGAALEWIATQQVREATGERHVEALGFTEGMDRWLKEKVEDEDAISPGCAAVYRSHANHLKRHFKRTLIQDITRDSLKKYFARRALDISARSLANEKRVLKAFMRYAHSLGWIARNPADLVMVKTIHGEIRFLDEAQEARFLKEARACGEDLYARCFAMCRSGLRGGTLNHLEWSRHIDWDRGEWVIPGSFMKAKKDFAAPIEGELLRYLRERRKPAGRIFTRLDRERFRLAAANAGMPWLHPHHLRKTFVSRCGRAGVGLEIAMSLSDHHDVTTMLRLYRGIQPDEKAAALRKAFPEEAKTERSSQAGA